MKRCDFEVNSFNTVKLSISSKCKTEHQKATGNSMNILNTPQLLWPVNARRLSAKTITAESTL